MTNRPRPSKLQKEWQAEYDAGLLTPQDLWDAGFRPRSNKCRAAVKEWKYYKKHYTVCLTLTPDEYEELKECSYRDEDEQRCDILERLELACCPDCGALF